MSNSNRRVLLFVSFSIGIFFLLSVASSLTGIGWTPFNRVNLISDLLISKEDSIGATDSLAAGTDEPLIVETKAKEDFLLYQKPQFITNFNADTSASSLNRFLQKLHDLKNGKPVKVRIAYFGDSMIEGDLLTQTLRKLLQQMYGGNGVGFVPITSPVSKFRQTVWANYSDGWSDDSFKEGKNSRLYLSGHSFHTSGAWVQMNDQTIRDSAAIIEKSLLCGFSQQPVSITVNNSSQTITATKTVNRIPLVNDGSRSVKLAVANDQLPVYGISFESAAGVFVDNFSFRGITGVEFARVDSAFLHAVAQNNPYDLIVFQYGVNLLFRPNDKNFSWYAKTMLPVVRKIRNCFPETDFLLVSTADRAFRYGGQYKSAIGIDSLIKVQALLAYQTNSSFYNQFATMGGTNSIVDWAKRKPSLANQDYVHPNHRGAEILGTYFYEAIVKEYEKYVHSLK